MNRLIIIGNGFDLAHGMKSSYGDFMDWYWRKVVRNIGITPSGTMYEDDLVIISTSQRVKGIPNLELPAPEIIEKLKPYFGKPTYKSTFFGDLMVSYSETNRWVDIELFYYSKLKILLKSYKANSSLSKSGFDEAIHDLNNSLTKIKELFIEYIEEIETPFKFDKPYKEIQSKYLNFFEHGTFETNRLDLSSQKFEKTLFLNFNYTTLAKDYFGHVPIDNPEDLEYASIHGSIKSPSSVIFGFGDELDEDYLVMERANDNRFFQHVKSFGYFRDIEYNKLDAFLAMKEPFRVDVLGHSLGLSDRTLLSQIFENPKLQEVNLCFYSSGQGDDDYTEKTYELSRHFSNKTRMREVVRKFRFSEPMPQIERSNQ